MIQSMKKKQNKNDVHRTNSLLKHLIFFNEIVEERIHREH